MKRPLRDVLLGKSAFMTFMLGPSIVVLFMLTIFPFIYSIYMSIHHFFMANPSTARFVGLSHYGDILFEDIVFWQSLKRTLIYVTGSVASQLIIGLIVAHLLEGIYRGKSIFRVLFLLPMAATPISIAFAWRIMYSPNLGVINYFLRMFGIGTIAWLSEPNLALLSLIIVDIWQWTPFMILMLLAGLMSLPEAPFEAARVDGANGWQIFTKVTIPLMEPIILIAVVFRVIDAFKAFDTIFVMTGGGPGSATQTINVYAFLSGFSYLRMGYTSAISIILLIVVIVVCQLLLRRSRLFEEEGVKVR